MPTDRAPDPPTDVLDSAEAGRRFLRGGVLRTLAYIGAVLASIGSTPLVTRHLHATAYGRLIAITSLMLIVASLTEGGLANLGIRELGSGSPEDRREFMRNLIGMRIVLSGVGAFAAVGFAVIAGYPSVMVAGTAIASVGLLFANLQATLALPLSVAMRLPWLAVIDFLGPAVTATTLIVLVVVRAPLLPFFLATVIAYAATTALAASLVRHEISLRPAFHARLWRRLLSDSVVLAVASAFSAIYFQVVVVAMSLLSRHTAAGTAQVGVFGLAFRVLSVINAVPALVIAGALPILVRAARDDRERLRYAVARLFEGSLLLGGWLSLLVISGAPVIARIMGGGDFPGSGTVLRILGAGVLASFLAALFGFSLISLAMYRAMVVITACMVALAVILAVLLIPAHGAIGGAIVTLSLEVVLASVYAATALITHPQLRPPVGPAARILAALVAAFLAAVLVPVSSVLAALIGTVVLVVAVLALRAAPPELLVLVRRHH